MSKLKWESLAIDEASVKDKDEYVEDTIIRIFNKMKVVNAIMVNSSGIGTELGHNFYVEFLVLIPKQKNTI